MIRFRRPLPPRFQTRWQRRSVALACAGVLVAPWALAQPLAGAPASAPSQPSPYAASGIGSGARPDAPPDGWSNAPSGVPHDPLRPTASDALAAADPASPVPALAPPPLAPVPAADTAAPRDLREALARWRQVNQRVAEFPRGHADLLRWEASQRNAPPADASTVRPEPLEMGSAVRQALSLHPDLLDRPGGSPAERWSLQQRRLALEHGTRRDWINAVAAHAAVRHQAAALESARIGVELGQRMVEAGNWSRARLLREQLTEARAHAAWLQAGHSARRATEALARRLGVWQGAAVDSLPQRLPAELPTPAALRTDAPRATEAQVLASSPVLAWQADQLRRQLAALPVAQRQAWAEGWAAAVAGTVPHASTHASTVSMTGSVNGSVNGSVTMAPLKPPVLADARLLKNHALEQAAEAEAQLLRAATERRSWTREAWASLLHAQASDRHAQDVLLPLLQAAEQETLLRYNGMLQSTWDLLAAARERLQGAHDAAQARRALWLAHTDWQALQAGGDYLPDSVAASPGGSGNTPDGDH